MSKLHWIKGLKQKQNVENFINTKESNSFYDSTAIRNIVSLTNTFIKGEDECDERWWRENETAGKKECGLHAH